MNSKWQSLGGRPLDREERDNLEWELRGIFGDILKSVDDPDILDGEFTVLDLKDVSSCDQEKEEILALAEEKDGLFEKVAIEMETIKEAETNPVYEGEISCESGKYYINLDNGRKLGPYEEKQARQTLRNFRSDA